VTSSWQTRYASKLCTAAEAVGRITPGQRIFIGSGAAEPAGLVRALVAGSEYLADNDVVHILTLGPAPYVAPEMKDRFRHTAFFIGPNVRDAVQQGRADFIPIFLSEVPSLIRSRRLKVDVALLQVSPPDAAGFVSLGVSVDVVLAAVKAAAFVIAQVNPRMPTTLGDSKVSVSELDCLVDLPEPLFELLAEPADSISTGIGELVASLVPDGATIQAGIGRIPNAVLNALRSRHDLGVHTEMLSDGFMALAKAGVVNGRRKTLRPGQMVTSFVMGSRELYDWVDQNPQVELHPSDFTNDPFVIAQNSRMVAINSALSVDLTGQVAADTVHGRFFSGIGGQVDFIRGAARSPGGRPIIALPSMAGGGSISRIVSALEAGAGVVTSRGDVHYVVTECGIAQLWGKSIRERAAALIEIAHPDVRPDLLNEAKQRRYLLPDHPLPNPSGRVRERLATLRTGEQVRIRPVRISDEDTLQELLYRLSDESTFFRFFGHTVTHPHREVLKLVELDSACGVALVAESMETEELLGIARADLDPRSGVAELGVTVADTWHNKGLGSLLLESLEAAARTSGFQALAAAVLPGNGRMQRLLRRRGFTCSGEPMDCPLTFTLALRDEAA
jgi:acyl-CoA hydrolase/GNAT superfamily N-acetyltransferase